MTNISRLSKELENSVGVDFHQVMSNDLAPVSQHISTQITKSQEKEASLGLEITALNQKIAKFDEIELAEFGTVLGKELTELEKNDQFQSDLRKIGDNPTQNEKLALTMSYNLVGSLCLFIKDGDTSGNIGDSFESRNISNGSVRDEDEWGEGLIRKNGDTIVCYASKDISDAANSLKSILDTVKVPQESNLRGLITKTQTALTDFNTAFFGTQGSSDFGKITSIPDNIDRLLKNELNDKSNEIVARVVQSSKITQITQKLGINGNDREKFASLLELLKNPEGNPKSKENLATSNTILKSIYSNVAREFIGSKLMTSQISTQDSPDIFKMMIGSL